jgi:hypothetical protein
MIGSRHGFSGAPVFNKSLQLMGIVLGGRSGVNLNMPVEKFGKQLVKEVGTQPSVKILPMNVIHAEGF